MHLYSDTQWILLDPACIAAICSRAEGLCCEPDGSQHNYIRDFICQLLMAHQYTRAESSSLLRIYAGRGGTLFSWAHHAANQMQRHTRIILLCQIWKGGTDPKTASVELQAWRIKELKLLSGCVLHSKNIQTKLLIKCFPKTQNIQNW